MLLTAPMLSTPNSRATSLPANSRTRRGRHTSTVAMPPLLHSTPTNEAPTTNPNSASNPPKRTSRVLMSRRKVNW
jgi:hypothetical protein